MRIPSILPALAFMSLVLPQVLGRALNGTHGGGHHCDRSFSLNVNHQCEHDDIFNWFACQNQANLSPECIAYINSNFYDYCLGGGYITASATTTTSTSTSTSTTTSTTTVTSVALTTTTISATSTTSVTATSTVTSTSGASGTSTTTTTTTTTDQHVDLYLHVHLDLHINYNVDIYLYDDINLYLDHNTGGRYIDQHHHWDDDVDDYRNNHLNNHRYNSHHDHRHHNDNFDCKCCSADQLLQHQQQKPSAIPRQYSSICVPVPVRWRWLGWWLQQSHFDYYHYDHYDLNGYGYVYRERHVDRICLYCPCYVDENRVNHDRHGYNGGFAYHNNDEDEDHILEHFHVNLYIDLHFHNNQQRNVDNDHWNHHRNDYNYWYFHHHDQENENQYFDTYLNLYVDVYIHVYDRWHDHDNYWNNDCDDDWYRWCEYSFHYVDTSTGSLTGNSFTTTVTLPYTTLTLTLPSNGTSSTTNTGTSLTAGTFTTTITLPYTTITATFTKSSTTSTSTTWTTSTTNCCPTNGGQTIVGGASAGATAAATAVATFSIVKGGSAPSGVPVANKMSADVTRFTTSTRAVPVATTVVTKSGGLAGFEWPDGGD
ncbi:hypothetical protein B0T20DRAFT_494231 [Sordaria brevicollis]|uniref:Uncharacterized protein n=1 Tax=Sordaria brevicollis TaxID=83679 RepID=A0AAE0PIJ2_SORBR|nr:hypothetical protein B0T20DRAFT_494231 [Sordaria brevicollis]